MSAAQRTERLLNLVIALLSTRRWLTKSQIRQAVPQYAECETDEAFDRMFDRDKEDLRELGVPLVTGTHSAFDDEPGYRVDRAAYALPELELTPAELAVVGLASRVWQQASLGGPAARALVKLRALGVGTDDDSLVGVEPRVRTSEPAFEPLYAATRDRAPVSFTYRRPQGDDVLRHVEPWALTSRSGWWYLVGHDRDRGAARVFRLSRIRSSVRRIGPSGSVAVPADLDARAMVDRQPGTPDERVALLRLRAGRGGALRLRARPDDTAAPGSQVHRDDRDDRGTRDDVTDREGWDVVQVPVHDVEELADELAGHADDVVVLEPADLAAAVVARLRSALAAQEGEPPGAVTPVPAEPRGRTTRADRVAPRRGAPPSLPGQHSATARLSRLLAMVPWLLQRQGVPLAEAARHFGVGEDELVKDLELLFVCGTPGHLPDDLIEAEWESGHIYLDNADAIARPLRLAVDEAVALLAGLRTLAQVPGLHDRQAVESALAKLSAAAGEAAAAATVLSADLSQGAQEHTLTALRTALSGHRRLHLTYLVPSRDETTERDVDPMRLMTVGGHWYLEAWCHRADDVRVFRVDRMTRVEVLDLDGTPPPDAVHREVDEQLFTPAPDDAVVTLELGARARWVADYYPVESARQVGDRLLVDLRTANPHWLPRLVLRLAGGARLVAPADLAAETSASARAALAAYPDAVVTLR